MGRIRRENRKRWKMKGIFGGDNHDRIIASGPVRSYAVRVIVEVDIHEKPAVLKINQAENPGPGPVVEQVTYRAGNFGPDMVDVLKTAALKLETHFEEILVGRGYGPHQGTAPAPEGSQH